MLRARLERAHAALVDVLREIDDLEDPAQRRVFEDCLAAARLVGRSAEDCGPKETPEIRLLQVA